MAVLILLANTTSPITVSCRRAGKSAPRRVGGVFPSFNGANRTSVRGEAKVIPIATSYLTAAEESAIQVAIANGVQIACSGDIVGNVQTLCSFDSVTSDIVPGTSPELWTMTFTMNEVNASTVLLKYAPGDTITGETFTRSTTGTYFDSNGVVQTAAINAKRDAHYIFGTRSLLLEDARTNGFIRAQEFDNAAWTKAGVTVIANAIAAPDGTVTADKIIEDGTTAPHGIYQTTTTTASTSQAHSWFAKAAERTWVVITTNLRDGTSPKSWVNLSTGAIGTQAGGHTVRVTTLGSSWFRIEVVVTSGVGASATNPVIGTATGDGVSSFLGVVGNGFYLWGAQHEQDQSFATSYIPTVAATVTRGADSYSMPFTVPPQEMTVYTKFRERGTVVAASGLRLWEISSAGGGTPHLIGYAPGAFYRTYHDNASVAVNSTQAAAPVIGDLNELLSRLFADGSVDSVQSINVAAETSSAQSSANTLGSAWSGLLLWLNSGGTAGGTTGFVAIQSFKIVAGTRSLAEMRGA